MNLQPMKSVLGKSGFFYNHNSKKSFQKELLRIMKNKKKITTKISGLMVHIKNISLRSWRFKHINFYTR